MAASEGVAEGVLSLAEPRDEPAALEPVLARLVESRFREGLDLDGIGILLGHSERSLTRDWRRPRAVPYAGSSAAAPAGASGPTPAERA